MPTIEIHESLGCPLIITKDKKDKNKILAYSAIKIKAKPPAPYSILNPDTSSDSPSAKSNGVRLVSATQETTHIKNKGNINKVNFKAAKDSIQPLTEIFPPSTR